MIAPEKCGLSAQTQEKLYSVFKKYNQIQKTVLYGSRAKGNFKVGSDIDLTIFSTEMKITELLKIQNEIDDLLLPYKVDLSLFHLIDNLALTEHIERVGVEFYISTDAQ